ncbi:MAG TPA: DUF1080 domain-containing protein [Bryobacteraceae bacterium]|nr:DUF1080 domain-containing protein [Bryobacteraceae bacterium]
MKQFALMMLSTAAMLFAQNNVVTPEEAAQGWVSLFDGETLYGWVPDGASEWRVAEGALVGDAGEAGWLRHSAEFSDFELKFEFRTAADGNSGVFIRSHAGGAPHLTGYEVQIFDKHEKFPTGSLVGHAAATGGAIKPGEWQAMEISAVGARYIVKLDGTVLLDTRDGKSQVGHVGLQYNKGKKIEFRNMKLRPTGLKPVTGWREVKPEKPAAEPAQWKIGESEIHVEKGPGQIETTGVWGDFVLQLDVKTNPKDANHHPNSGVFFRGTPNTWWSGYESQIRNEYSDGDAAKPVDYGTGAIYRTNPARRIVAKDGEFFTKTIVARGRQMNVWVNGYLVTSWSDSNLEGASVREKKAVLKAGTISLQAHDPTTNLDFKNLRIATLPPAAQ